jgi:hypothetical protein
VIQLREKPMAAASMTAVLAGAAMMAAAATAHAATIDPSVIVFDQALADKSVDVSYAYLPEKGYLAVYPSDAEGKPVRQALGTTELKAGDHRNVKITLSEAPKAGQRFWVSIYRDADNKAGFDSKADQPVWKADIPAHNSFLAR